MDPATSAWFAGSMPPTTDDARWPPAAGGIAGLDLGLLRPDCSGWFFNEKSGVLPEAL